MELKESVAAAMASQDRGECAICGGDHPAPKRAKFEPVAPKPAQERRWGRISMSDVPVTGSARTAIYPGGLSSAYPTQGHHCIALSALVANANSKTRPRRDRRLRLNFYLDKAGYFPNGSSNCIHLPSRTSRGDYDAFWKAVRMNKPLQLHGPAHAYDYFLQCDVLLLEVVECIKAICEDSDEAHVLEELKKTMTWAENYAFKMLASCEEAWDLHPAERQQAEMLYYLSESESDEVTKAHGVVVRVAGLGRTEPKYIRYPRPHLDCGPYAT